MTVKDFLKKLESEYPPGLKNKRGEYITDVIKESTYVWNNASASGYALQAMRDTGFSEADILKVQKALHNAYDEFTVGEAANIFNEWNRI